MKRWIILFAGATGLVWGAGAVPGRLETVGGEDYQGDVRATNGFLVVVSTNGPGIRVAPGELRLARFEGEGEGEGRRGGAGAEGRLRGNGLLGHYFANTNLEGRVMVRLDETVDFAWAGSAMRGLAADRFSVVWTGKVEAPATGRFIFSIATDQGGRLQVEDRQVAEVGRWRGRTTQIDSIPLMLEAGRQYPLRFTFYDTTGPAEARLGWRGPGVATGVIPREHLYAVGLVTGHVASVTREKGLLGTYYRGKEFSGETLTRVDPQVDFKWVGRDPAPGFARTNFSVRWTGRVLADHTEEYTFYTMTAGRVRLWVDKELLIDRPTQKWTAENSDNLLMAAGERYDIRLETEGGRDGGVARLMWSSRSMSKRPIPESHLFPSRPSRASAEGAGDSGKIPTGVLLRSGAFVACTVESASRSSIRATGLLQGMELPTVAVARILCQPISPAMAERLVPGRAGLLLAKGDFVDGEFRGLDEEDVRLSSVLFGTRSYDRKAQVLVAVLGETAPGGAAFEVGLRDQTVLPALALFLEPDKVVVEAATLGRLSLPAAEVAWIRRVDGKGGGR